MSSWLDEAPPKDAWNYHEDYWKAWVDSLQNTRWMSNTLGSSHTADRLGDHVVEQLRRAGRAAKDDMVIAFLANRFERALMAYEKESRLLIRLADTGYVTQLLHRMIDAALGVLHIQDPDVRSEWHRQLDQERGERVASYQLLLENRTQLAIEMGDGQQKLEVLTRMKHGLVKYHSVLTPGELDVISALFDQIVWTCGVIVGKLPSWFDDSQPIRDDVESTFAVSGEEDCLRQTSIWSNLNHPHIRKFYSACHVGKPHIVHDDTVPIDELNLMLKDVGWFNVLDCALGLQYLHERGVVHRNLSADNLCFSVPTGNAVLSGLGLLPFCEASVLSHGIWSRWWKRTAISPSLASDVLAFGLCIFELIKNARKPGRLKTRLLLRKAKKFMLQRTNLCLQLPAHRPKYVTREEWLLLQQMCRADPATRCSMLEVVYQIRALPQISPQTSDNHERGETVDNVRTYSLVTLGLTLEQVIQEMDENSAQEIEPVHRPVFLRLKDVFRQLCALPDPPRVYLVENFAIIALRLYKALEQASSLGYSGSRASAGASQTMANRGYGLHHDIDRFLREEPRIRGDDDVHQWQPNWKEACHFEREALQIGFNASSSLQEQVQSGSDLNVPEFPVLPPWFTPAHQVELGNHIADGSFGAVYHGKWLDSDVVVKLLLTNHLDKVNQEQFRHEADLWFSLNHDNLLKLYGVCHIGRPFFVCERAMGGTLVDHARKQDHPGVWMAIDGAIKGLEHLHSIGIVHGDLKGNNILMSSGVTKLVDFGLSVAVDSEEHSDGDYGALGAYRWKAPECLSGSRPTFASDMFSMGMCIIEIVTGELPWGKNAMPDSAIRHLVVERRALPSRPDQFTDAEWNLVTHMCCFNPEDRLTAPAVSTIIDLLVANQL